MSEEKNLNKCSKKRKAMFAYGFIQISSTVISAIALTSIALGFCSLRKEAKVFNECVEQTVESGSPITNAVRFCNGG